MTIAVDARFFATGGTHSSFVTKIFCKLAQLHETHNFIFFFDKPDNTLADAPHNVATVVITPSPTNFLLYKWWYDVKIARALQRYKATIFVGTNGIISLSASIPQLLIISNLNFPHHSVAYPKSIAFFYKYYMPRFLKKATAAVTFSNFARHKIISIYKISEDKITSAGCAADDVFQPVGWAEKEKIKERFAQGCEYFIYRVNGNLTGELITLLKAFSIFKKWQKTNMKLLVTINANNDKEQEEKLKSYRYRNELIFVNNLSDAEVARITAAAYAAICTSSFENPELDILEAMQCEVPVITSENAGTKEIAGEAALYVNASKPEEIAEQMKRIFKDEQLRSKLMATGREIAKAHSYDKTINLLWQKIEQIAAK